MSSKLALMARVFLKTPGTPFPPFPPPRLSTTPKAMAITLGGQIVRPKGLTLRPPKGSDNVI